MAGLQYNFFPTDFFYPRPAAGAAEAGKKSSLPLQIQKRSDGDSQHDVISHPGRLILHTNANKSAAVENKRRK
ncbi:hypothetical protein LINGRAHAP2_LOCUS16497 [Linum grandiflorum]